jgi:hypothetical protein
MRVWCWIFGHSLRDYDVGHDTGVTIYHCRRCPHFWWVS